MITRTEWLPGEMEDTHRIERVFAKQPWPGFEAAVQEYRQIEADLIARPGIEPWYLLELRRRIAEWILTSAERDDVPFEQFQEAWNGLLELGFTDIDRKQYMAWLYADYCLTNGHYDAGLEVIEPVLAEFEQSLQGKPQIPRSAADELASLKLLRDGLLAFRTGDEEVAKAWLAREEAEITARRQRNEEEREKARSKNETP
jgi:hypothetical protein